MGSWFTAKRAGTCAACRRPFAAGEQAWLKARGVCYCELCGLMAEVPPETAEDQPEAGPGTGPIESGVTADLTRFPRPAAASVIAQMMLSFARQLDAGDVAPRDQPGYFQQIRQGLLQLELAWPPVPDADDTQLARSRRERRLLQTGDADAPEH